MRARGQLNERQLNRAWYGSNHSGAFFGRREKSSGVTPMPGTGRGGRAANAQGGGPEFLREKYTHARARPT